MMTHSIILMYFLTCSSIKALEKEEQIGDDDELNIEEPLSESTDHEEKDIPGFQLLNSIQYTKVMKIPESEKGDHDFDRKICTNLPWATVHSGISREPTIAEATIKNFPYMVQIMVDKIFHCSGTLLTRKHVMTAAKCVVEFLELDSYERDSEQKKGLLETISPNRLVIRVGSSRLYKGGHTHEVREVVTHPNYHWSTSSLDLAILTLRGCVDLSDKVNVAHIPPDCGKDHWIEANFRTQAPGWGFEITSTYNSRSVLHVDNEYLYDNGDCRKIYKYSKHKNYINFPTFCVSACTGIQDDGLRLSSKCQGDVGGPVYYRHKYFIAVVLFRRGCLFPKYPTFSSVVCLDHEWIKEETQNLQPDCTLERVANKSRAESEDSDTEDAVILSALFLIIAIALAITVCFVIFT